MALQNNIYRVLCVVGLLAVADSASISIGEPHIIGGAPIPIEQYPFQASLIQYGRHSCGASILGPKYIVTAAHCLDAGSFPTEYQLRVGSSSRSEGGTVIELHSFFRHPSYMTRYKFEFDVAVATLAKSIQFGAKVQPIALVPINKEPQTGEMVTASGWGDIMKNKTRTDILRAITIPIVSRSDCRKPSETKITNNMICAGSYGKSVFRGDSGGPLVNSKKELVGIASFASMENPSEVAGGFTNVASPPIHQFITQHFPEPNNHGNQ